MRPIHNWKAVLCYAWSIRFLLLAAVLFRRRGRAAACGRDAPALRGIFAASTLKGADPVPVISLTIVDGSERRRAKAF